MFAFTNEFVEVTPDELGANAKPQIKLREEKEAKTERHNGEVDEVDDFHN
jgi:hypothetical protein